MKKAATLIYLMAIISAVLLLTSRTSTVAAATCNPMELSPCYSAMTGSAEPSAACCAKLTEQQPCFCQYMKNPILKGYVTSSNSKKVATACKVQPPAC